MHTKYTRYIISSYLFYTFNIRFQQVFLTTLLYYKNYFKHNIVHNIIKYTCIIKII